MIIVRRSLCVFSGRPVVMSRGSEQTLRGKRTVAALGQRGSLPALLPSLLCGPGSKKQERAFLSISLSRILPKWVELLWPWEEAPCYFLRISTFCVRL